MLSESATDWRGQRRVFNERGYAMRHCPKHPCARSNHYVYEHTLVVEEMLGRPLERGEIVHHKNGDPQDNRPENLIVTNRSQHARNHWKEQPEAQKERRLLALKNAPNARRKERRHIQCACGCGASLVTPNKWGRDREFIHGHNPRGRHWKWQLAAQV